MRIEAVRGGALEEEPPIAFEAMVLRDSATRLILSVTTRLEDQAGEEPRVREVLSSSCEELALALVQMVSLSLGPREAGASSPAAAPVEVEGREPEPAGERDAPRSAGFPELDPPDAEVRRPERPTTEAEGNEVRSAAETAAENTSERAGAVAILGFVEGFTFEGPSFGVLLEGVAAVTSHAELRVFAGYVPRRSLWLDDESGAGGRLSLALGGALGCVGWSGDGGPQPLCAGFEVGRIGAQGTGVTSPASEAALWAAARAEARAGFPLVEGLRMTLLGGLVFPLLRHEFRVAGAELHRLPALAFRGGVGLEYGF